MAPNEQEGAANQQEAAEPEKKEAPKLGSLSAVEAVVNQYARKYAKRYRVDENEFTVVLSTEFSRGVMGIRRGPVSQIILRWPDAQLNINTLLDDAFRVISRKHLVDTMAVEPVFLIRRRAEERRRLIREKIGHDESDIILDLVPKHRIVTTVTTTVEYRDVITGETYSVTHKERPEQYRGQDVSSWLKLSRIIRDNHPEEATRYADPIAEEVCAASDSDADAASRPVGGDDASVVERVGDSSGERAS
jgi:hypothetical protein